MVCHDPLSAALEVREQLASEKRRLAFFIGAGTSMAVGFPGIDHLTDMVSERLVEPLKVKFGEIRTEISQSTNIEAVLDRIRIYCELLENNKEKRYSCLIGDDATNLDRAICKIICDIFCENPPNGFSPHMIFSQWLGALRNNRDWPVEIFTTNYDLLFEKAMEIYGIPFFDGFIGSVNPFFIPEAVEAGNGTRFDLAYPPKGWTRLWKIHGSINWRLIKHNNINKIVRLSGTKSVSGEDLVIFPSREKYAQSRKLPYIAFQDRLRKVLMSGECLLVVIGYSFSDQHLNEIILQGLRSNPGLAVIALIYGDVVEGTSPPEFTVSKRVLNLGREHRNLTIYGTDQAAIGGIVANWSEPHRKRNEGEVWPFWNEEKKIFTLGDFNKFSEFLELFIGFQFNVKSGEQITELSNGVEQ